MTIQEAIASRRPFKRIIQTEWMMVVGLVIMLNTEKGSHPFKIYTDSSVYPCGGLGD